MTTMPLGALRAEVLGHGFDKNTFSSRINTYLNDAQEMVCRRVEYYVDEATADYPTIIGTAMYSLPADFAKVRSIRNTNLQQELQSCGLRDIDRSIAMSATPTSYAMDGANLHFYPTPDSVYPMELRYWKQPADLVLDTDISTIPGAYHRLLWYWATAEAYRSEDDMATGDQWEQKFNTLLAEFAADVKFPNDDASTQIADMWTGPRTLGPRGWTRSGSDWG